MTKLELEIKPTDEFCRWQLEEEDCIRSCRHLNTEESKCNIWAKTLEKQDWRLNNHLPHNCYRCRECLAAEVKDVTSKPTTIPEKQIEPNKDKTLELKVEVGGDSKHCLSTKMKSGFNQIYKECPHLNNNRCNIFKKSLEEADRAWFSCRGSLVTKQNYHRCQECKTNAKSSD